MFTRVVEITSKSGKTHEVANTIHEKILPILRKQTGFVDETVPDSEQTLFDRQLPCRSVVYVAHPFPTRI